MRELLVFGYGVLLAIAAVLGIHYAPRLQTRYLRYWAPRPTLARWNPALEAMRRPEAIVGIRVVSGGILVMALLIMAIAILGALGAV